MKRSVYCLFGAGLAPFALRAYQSRYSQYQKSCERTGVAPTWIPTSEQTLCLLVAFLADGGIAHSTRKNALSAVLHVRIRHGLETPLAVLAAVGVLFCTRRYAVGGRSQMTAAITNHSRCVLLRLTDHWAQE